VIYYIARKFNKHFQSLTQFHDVLFS